MKMKKVLMMLALAGAAFAEELPRLTIFPTNAAACRFLSGMTGIGGNCVPTIEVSVYPLTPGSAVKFEVTYVSVATGAQITITQVVQAVVASQNPSAAANFFYHTDGDFSSVNATATILTPTMELHQ